MYAEWGKEGGEIMYETQRQDKAGQVSGEVAGTGKEDCGEGVANGPICKTHDETQQCNTVVCTDCGIDIEAAGQDVQHIGERTFCEDCWRERHEEEERNAIEERRFQDNLVYGMSLEIAG